LNVIDISMALSVDLPVWPDSPGLAVDRRLSLERGDEVNVSTLTMDVHTGTHVDAPRHFLADGSELALVGVDYLSAQGFADPPDAHTVLLGPGVALLDGLVLNHVTPGRYLLACLPLRLGAVEAARARAILVPTAELDR
jgi:kynurenine formamidase